MKTSTLLAGAAALYHSATPVLALPSMMMPDLGATEMLEFRQLADRISQEFDTRGEKSPHASKRAADDASYMGVQVETTGEHEYVSNSLSSHSNKMGIQPGGTKNSRPGTDMV